MAEARPNAAAEAETWYRKASDKGSATAAKRLGEAYRDGTLGLTKDDGQALGLFRRAADAGLVPALAEVAHFIENGRGAERDPAAAMPLWRQAADKGLAVAQYRMGYAAQIGEFGVPHDDAEAVRWYRLAAAQENPNAQVNLGAMLLAGIGVEQDGGEAVKWYQRAAAHGNMTGEYMLGSILWDGKGGQKQDQIAAVQHFRAAADHGNAAAQYMLSVAYRLGEGVPVDEKEMLAWARKAAEQGEGMALNSLGYSILTGIDGTYDFVEAACWLTLAVERITVEAERQRAQVNLDNALEQLNDAEKADATARAARWRVIFADKR